MSAKRVLDSAENPVIAIATRFAPQCGQSKGNWPAMCNSAILNRSLRLYRDPVDLSRVLTSEYLMADQDARTEIALSMIAHIAASSAAALRMTGPAEFVGRAG